MSPLRRNIDIIHTCEQHFYNWLRTQLLSKGIESSEKQTLSALLSKHLRDLAEFRQQLIPLNKWDKQKTKCYKIKSISSDDSDLNDAELELFEQTAFEGQILLMTFQDN